MSITLNSITIAQPKADGVKEEVLNIYHDRMKINGSIKRYFYGTKKQATLSWDALAPADYQTLMGLFTTGLAITYSNPTSAYSGGTFSFSGLPLHSEDAYIPGNSLLRTMTVTLRET